MTPSVDIPMPADIAALPRDHIGRPIPWFVATLADGTRDFRVADSDMVLAAIRDRLCWVCGRPRGSFQAFVIGPINAVNRLAPEPPSHRACARYAALACPFLNTPQMVRRERGLITVEEGRTGPPGVMVLDNPGVALLWVTRRHTLLHPPGGGVLWRLGEPTAVEWYARGRAASRTECLASLESGLSLLEAECGKDEDPVAARAFLARDYERALTLLPAGEDR